MFQTEHLQESGNQSLSTQIYQKSKVTVMLLLQSFLENQEKSLKEDRAFLSGNAPTNSSFGGNASMDGHGIKFLFP